MRLKRFTPVQRLFHVLLMVFFLLQAATGLGRMYFETVWGKSLAGLFGGYGGSLAVHKVVGVCMLVLFGLHLLYVLAKLRRKSVFGPDSLVPGPRDLGQFIRHLGWMIGLAKHPRFERWGYWEKFDYWAVFWGMVIIGGTGLLLYDPVVTSRYFHGKTINVALWVHRIEALLAIGHVFIIHFFIVHFRKRSFPMDRAMFEGSVDLEHAREEKPAWVARLEAEGALQANIVTSRSLGVRVLHLAIGYAAIVCGVLLLVYALLNVPYLTL